MPEDWWPDWRGETVVIAASGPSQRKEDLDYVRGKARVMVINNTWTLAPWADCLYACDCAWWITEDTPGKEGYGQRAMREFPGLKVSGQQVNGIPRIRIDQINAMLWTQTEFGGGGNSAFQAVMLALLWGAKDGGRVILTGVDCKAPGKHWHGTHPVPLAQTPAERVNEWAMNWNKLAKALERSDMPVINCSRDTALECFPRAKVEDVL